MALKTLIDVATLMGSPAAATYLANRPVLFATIENGAKHLERLNADQHGNHIETGAPVAPSVP